MQMLPLKDEGSKGSICLSLAGIPPPLNIAMSQPYDGRDRGDHKPVFLAGGGMHGACPV